MHKINFLGRIPRDITLACSGGPDSMAVLDFLKSGNKNVRVAYFDHGTDHGSEAYSFIKNYCQDKNIKINTGPIKSSRKPKDQSWEEWWRNSRYEFFNSLSGSDPIITCHHLNDAAEWWIFTSLNGNPRLIPHRNGRVIRPFLTTPKESLVSWCTRKKIPFVTDPGNAEVKFARSRIRSEIMPQALLINPGFLTVVRKKLEENYKREVLNEV